MAEEDNRRGDLNMVEEVPALAAVNGENHVTLHILQGISVSKLLTVCMLISLQMRRPRDHSL